MAYPITIAARAQDGTKLGTVYLRNAPEDADKIIKLRTSMMSKGWVGRPVIMMDAGDHHIAFSGSHRLAAAQGLEDVIEVVWLPADLSLEEWEEIEAANDDDDLLKAFETIAHDRDDMAEVIEVIKAEIESNNA